MTLTKNEEIILMGLLEKLSSPISPDVFRVLMRKTVSVPIELAVFNSNNQILMIFRKDEEYNGHHLPGTVLRNDENVNDALKRLIAKELAGANILNINSVGWVEIPRGTNQEENPTRHEISLLHVGYLNDKYKGSGEFFYPEDLPLNILSHHRRLIREIINR